jgi:hypothetical protein
MAIAIINRSNVCRASCLSPLLAIIGGVACCIAGCGRADDQNTVEVTGRVTLNGQPLTSGMVAFMSPQGPVAKGCIGSDGSFRMEPYTKGRGTGVVVGQYRVVISAPDPKALASANKADFVPSLIPERYTMPTTSRLTCDVKAGIENSANFELKSP